MSPDLDPAVEAAAVNAYHARATDGTPGVHHDFLAAVVAAVAPLIRAQERAAVAEEIATAIEAYRPVAHPACCPPEIAYDAARETAARIARGRATTSAATDG